MLGDREDQEPPVAYGDAGSQVMAAVGDTGGFRSALRTISIALLTYAASALFMGASAGVFTLGSPLGGLVGPIGVILAFVGLLLAAASLAFLLRGTRRLLKAAETLPTRQGWVAKTTALLGGSACAVLSVGVPTIIISAPFRETQTFYWIGLFMVTAGAFAFLVAVALPVVAMGRRFDRIMAVIAVVINSIAVVGELILSLPPWRGGSDWFSLGGLPFLNWNLPFGALAAFGSLVLWRAYGDSVSK